MKEFLDINKIVGDEPKTDRKATESGYRIWAGEVNEYVLKENAREKSPEEIEFIKEMNGKLKEFLGQYGSAPTEIPVEKVILIDPKSKLSVERDSTLGGHVAGFVLVYRDKGSTLLRAHVIVHESIHFSGFNSLTGKNSATEPLTGSRRYKLDGEEYFLPLNRRIGFSMESKGGQRHFDWLNEAITEELTERFTEKYFAHMAFTDAAFQKAQEMKQRLSEDPELAPKTHKVIFLDSANGVQVIKKPYFEERQRFNALLDKIFEDNRDAFANREEVFSLFARAAMQGSILPVARLIEKTLGKGAFRALE